MLSDGVRSLPDVDAVPPIPPQLIQAILEQVRARQGGLVSPFAQPMPPQPMPPVQLQDPGAMSGPDDARPGFPVGTQMPQQPPPHPMFPMQASAQGQAHHHVFGAPPGPTVPPGQEVQGHRPMPPVAQDPLALLGQAFVNHQKHLQLLGQFAPRPRPMA